MHLIVNEVDDAFEPEGGAYASGDSQGHGHGHAHAHGDAHGHGHDHAPGHAHDHAHGPPRPRPPALMPRVRRPAAPVAPGVLLQLMWLASPALPVGGFSYSEGLEAAVESGHVTTEATASAWLLDQLHLSLARSDIAVAAQGVRGLAARRPRHASPSSTPG